MANPKPKPPFKPKTVIGRSLRTADDQFEKDYPNVASSSVYKKTKNAVKDIASKLGFKKGGTVKTKKKKK
jgi:hypothetical protein